MSEETSVLHYEIVTPHSRVGAGECEMLVAPAATGEVGILPRHAPYLSALGIGVLRIRKTDREEKVFVAGGFLEVLENKIVVLAEQAERPEQIDVARAEAALERARRRLETFTGLGKEGEGIDRVRARRAFQRAVARLKTAGRRD
ncbi:MAG: F0F1 ATP synthase subunit epsilon [Candidatus Hydrogenedentota bacterium]|nr:MAG: F0F1 ATP synthase subunit epsilon [Candidatus Hydrogenedentota bacterium]